MKAETAPKKQPQKNMVAYSMANANADIPKEVCDALQGAMEIAIANVPAIEGRACLPGRLGFDVAQMIN